MNPFNTYHHYTSEKCEICIVQTLLHTRIGETYHTRHDSPSDNINKSHNETPGIGLHLKRTPDAKSLTQVELVNASVHTKCKNPQ